MTIKKKLIEVALPLDAINKASAREKSIRHGHPSTVHLWWARRPLAAARAVIFSQMVDDPSAHPDLFPTVKAQEKERHRLFKLIEDLVLWESTTNEKVLQSARDEMWQSWRAACAEHVDHTRAKELFDRHTLPAFHDPFSGGGALPLEAQRLGLSSWATDLNPVAVLINKATVEIPPRFAGREPVHPEARKGHQRSTSDSGLKGLADDVRQYASWMRDEAKRRIGHLFPDAEITKKMTVGRPDLVAYQGRRLPIIAWVWARTVRSPSPAFPNVKVPLAATFLLGTKPGKEVYVEPVIEQHGYRFVVRVGVPKDKSAAENGTKLSRANFRCVMSKDPIPGDYIKQEGKAGRLGARLMAVVAEGDRGRVYLSPTDEMEEIALSAAPEWRPEGEVPARLTGGTCVPYGLETWGDLFTARQTVSLTTFADLVQEARARAARDAASAGFADAEAYGDAVATYLGLAVGRVSDYSSTICTWANNPQMEIVRGTFARQALPMTWDFAETNPFGPSTGSIDILAGWIAKAIERLPGVGQGIAEQRDATQEPKISGGSIISTDPPYYDNIGYADLSDYFYVWLRRALKPLYPQLFATMAVPKSEELVAAAYRHGSKEKAEHFFLSGMTRAMTQIAAEAHPAFPVTIYYAFKQAETDTEEGGGTSSTGWDTFLGAVIQAGFTITGTWPVRTERGGRSVGIGANALASSIVLVCRKRSPTAPVVSRREFHMALKADLPGALAHLQRGNIAPVDLAQAAIGPGMAVFTQFSKVLDAKGEPLSVRDALALINQELDEALAEQEGDFDADSRWALAWFEQAGFAEGEYGIAETLSKAKNTSIRGLELAGILKSAKGKVRLLKPSELSPDWDPATDERLTTWETVHHLIRVLDGGGEAAAATLVAKLGSNSEAARELAYRLYTLCERKKRSAEALAYNGLVQSWPEITRLAREGNKGIGTTQGTLFAKDEE